MKRRKFIKATLVAPVLAGNASAGTRIFGVPGSLVPSANSLEDKLVLPLAKSGLPPQFWGKLRAVSSVVAGVLNSPDEASEFARSPARYLQAQGLDHSDGTLQDETVKLVVTLSNPSVREAISRKDHVAFMRYLKATGALDFDASFLQMELESALSRNVGEIRELLSSNLSRLPTAEREAFLTILANSGSGATEDDLAIACELMSSEIEGSPSSIVAATIALVVVTVAAAAVLWVYTAGWVWGGPVQPRFAGTNFAKLAEADPKLAKNYERAIQLATIAGEKELLEQGVRELILAESIAVVSAMKNAGVLDITDEGVGRLSEAMSAYVYRMAGV